MKNLIITFFLYAFSLNAFAQTGSVTLSGIVHDDKTVSPVSYAHVVLKQEDSVFVSGTITNDDGLFSIRGLKPGNYILEISAIGFTTKKTDILIGRLSEYLDLGTLTLSESVTTLGEVTVVEKKDAVAETLDKKTFNLSDNINQNGGSLLQAMQNLPGVTVGQEGTVKLRGSDRVTILVDGKQTALTGFGNQVSLDNIPASAIERIEIINNPSAKFDANGNAGIINIIFKKEEKNGFNGKVGMMAGAGALWEKKSNYPTIRPQYQRTPKLNPSVSINYRNKKINLFLQADNLYTRTLNKNEFSDRFYSNGDTIRQQLKRNRTTNVFTGKGGFDWFINDKNTITASTLVSSEKILDRGDEPFFNGDLSERLHLWQFLEDELKTTATTMATWHHQFLQPGRTLNVGLNYTFHRENEKYFFTNIYPDYTGSDAFKLLSDEHVTDLNADYIQPLRRGRFETGVKIRRREIPTDMHFIPGINSPLDTTAGGWANYYETIPAVYGNYVFENKNFEIEAGLRAEYVDVKYTVNPEHPVYRTDGYHYMKPFPNLRFAWLLDNNHTLSFFYNRRVDRPNEVDIRIFPKYDDAEIIKVGNPGLRPQFTSTLELGYKTSFGNGYWYTSLYHKIMDATITRIASIAPGSNLIYNIFQNAGKSYTSGVEIIIAGSFSKRVSYNINFNGYQNIIEAFSVLNKYPRENLYTSARQEIFSGSVKLNGTFHLTKSWDVQLSGFYSAPDIIPQGKIYARYSVDLGARKIIQKGKGEILLNASDLANSLKIKRRVTGDGFILVSSDYYETQVVRMGYSYKF